MLVVTIVGVIRSKKLIKKNKEYGRWKNLEQSLQMEQRGQVMKERTLLKQFAKEMQGLSIIIPIKN
jgi:hypothetical protein